MLKKIEIDLNHFLKSNFGSTRKKKFSHKEKQLLRPVAETLAMLDGNAFFGMSIDEDGNDMFYEQYLPEAYLIFKANGGPKGWAGEVSWVKQTEHENVGVREAYEIWQMLKKLSKG